MRVALDTNVLAYAAGVNDDRRRNIAEHLLRSISAVDIVLPVQVLGELHAVLVRRRKPREAAAAIVMGWLDFYATCPTTADCLTRAAGLAATHQLATWDALILAAASEAGCALLLSEDMHEGFIWGGVTVVNPFADDPHPLLHQLLQTRH